MKAYHGFIQPQYKYVLPSMDVLSLFVHAKRKGLAVCTVQTASPFDRPELSFPYNMFYIGA